MSKLDDGQYWERACEFFRAMGAAQSGGSYFLHNKNAETVRIGIGCQVSVSVARDSVSYTADGRVTVSALGPGDHVFKRVEGFLRKDAPCFFVVSPDIHRKSADPSLPLIKVVQPAVEFVFSAEQSEGVIGYALDPSAADLGRAKLRDTPSSVRRSTSDPAALRPFAELIDGWVPDEEDESFLARLTDAVRILQGHRDGKMTLTRAYHQETGSVDPFELYVQHAAVNGEYACSHYFCVREDVFSVGTTPENVFEVDHGTLTVDVVAATCRYSEDDDFLARELYENPKQLKEHRSSLDNRQNRFRPFCEESSIRVVQDMQIKALRNVCHLHSKFSGKLLAEVTTFDLLGSTFPLLGARPKELLEIADPEVTPHRYYGGIVGHAHGDSGACFLNIRNALLADHVIHAKVGVGVLAESDPVSELLETQDKLSGVLEAIALMQSTHG